MKVPGVLSARILLVALVASSTLVEAVRPLCLCGGLGAGTNPCRGECRSGSYHVKAAKSLKPSYFASESAINEVAAVRAAAAVNFDTPSVTRSGGCGGSSSSSPASSGQTEEHRHTVHDLLMLGPHIKIAPRFTPIGDLCHQNTPIATPRTSTTVIPAWPGKPRCFACDGPSFLPSSPPVHGAACAGHRSQGRSLSSNSGSFGTSGVYKSLDFPTLNPFETEDHVSCFDNQESSNNGQQLPSLPADAVSVSLAYRNLVAPHLPQNFNNKKRRIVEGHLSFGPRTIPADGQVKQAPTADIPEECLVNVDKPIVELKATPIAKSGGGWVDASNDDEEDLAEQEAIERERMNEAAEAQTNQGSGAYITYSELGYGPVTSSGNKFINAVTRTEHASAAGPGSSSGYDDETPCGPMGKPLSDYRPGTVIVREEGEYARSRSSDRYEGVEEDESVDSYEEEDNSAECGCGSSSSSRSSTGGLSKLWATSSDSFRSENAPGCMLH